MLTGADLLAKVKELGDVSKSDMAKACGYVSTKKDGGERINFTSFLRSTADAKGIDLGGGSAGIEKGGRKLSTRQWFKATATSWLARPTQPCLIFTLEMSSPSNSARRRV